MAEQDAKDQECREEQKSRQEAPATSPAVAGKDQGVPLEIAQELNRGAEVALEMFNKYDKTILDQERMIEALEKESQQLRQELESCRTLQESQADLKQHLQGASEKIQQLRNLFFGPEKRNPC